MVRSHQSLSDIMSQVEQVSFKPRFKKLSMKKTQKSVEYKPVQLVARLVVQVAPTASAAQAARRAVIAAVRGWHPLVPGDQLDMACRIACRVSGQRVC